MNILMVSLDFPPTVGGIAAHVFELSSALTRLGHKVDVITRWLPSRPVERETLGALTVHRLRLRGFAPLYGWQINRFIAGRLGEIRPDLIHIHGMAPLEGFKIASVPLVYTNHTSGYLERIRKGGVRRMALLRRLFAKPKLFIAPSRELLEVPFPIAADKRYIPNGVDAEKYRFDAQARSRLRRELGMANEHVVAILTRRLVEKNGVIYFARAVKRADDPRLRAVLIGDGPEREKVARALADGFPGRYVMLGAMTHDEIVPYYSAADFSVLPSLMEATSISGLEAMSCSLALVGTRVGGIPDLVEDGKNGLLCEAADEEDMASKIRQLLRHDLKALGAYSRHLVEARFAWPRIAAQTVEAYESLS